MTFYLFVRNGRFIVLQHRLTFLYHRMGITSIIRESVVTCYNLLWILQLVFLLEHVDEMRYSDIVLVGTSEYFVSGDPHIGL